MHRLAETLDAVRATRSRKAKVAALSALFKSLTVDELPIAARLVLGELLPPTDPRQLGVGWALVAEAAVEAAPGGSMAELSALSRARGDLGDGAGALLAAHGGDAHPGLTLLEVGALIERLASNSERSDRGLALTAALTRARPAEAAYLVKALLGELRVGVQLGILEEGIATAFERPLEVLRKASALLDIGALATAAQAGTLEQAATQVEAPVSFMLATPAESVKTPLDPARTIAEDKLDGVRAQAHVLGERVRLFARGQGEVTHSFPEVVTALAGLPRAAILDGEIIAVAQGGRARPFHVLQARIGRKNPSAELQAKVPVAYVAYDLLFDGEPVLERPWSERRERLAKLLEGHAVVLNPVHRFEASQPLEPQIEALFALARGRGNEGLVLKSVEAPYEAGRRGASWRKVKKAGGTLDVVVTKVEWGHGKRLGVLSDYTFAVWDGGELKDIGKAYSGLTDVEISALTTRFEALTIERHGGMHVVTPEVVIEVAFDGLQKSKRHASGFSMRFPRIHRVRDDKRPEDADTLEAARAIFEAQVASGHREGE
ncbi:MAG: ATP-dependent DNA ligase [Archangiaceae bacterium]|nr:ATP-dependent DNA ligase [Archangiaceae bacterium]